MLQASNPISILLDMIFAMINIALTIVFGYLGTIATYALIALLLFGITLGILALVRNLRR